MSRQKSTKRLRNETKGRGSRETAEPDIANMARPMTHLPHRPRTSFVRLFLGRPDRRPGSWSRMMSSKRLKTRARRGRQRNFHIKLSRNLPIPLTQKALRRLLFRCSTATSLKKRLQKHDERSAIHLSHAGSHQGLPALQE